ncbi:G-type lectin S-receptor-like serine/threonine-protein kinase CES101 isoform X4 [Quercus suber]|uniref:G-type lectin S-receptor-like serine/threonine-protein kinase CES101 isoform X4 n=1 Tax=Quercus suber TaxID=58331 RepID=UPI0032DF3BAD
MDTNVVQFFKLVFLLFFPCMWTPHDAQWVHVSSTGISSAGDSINPGDTLNSSTYIVSEKGTFALGFFHRIDSTTTTTETYLAISEMAEADQILPFNLFVWFGSRDRPIVNNSVMLTLDNNGTLKIVQKGGDPIVLYSPPQPTKNTVATLLDSGNFILKEVQSNGSIKRVLWQSFDYPADTLLPGMKLGVRHKTGQTWSLTSWLTDEIPVPGPLALEWDPKGYQLIIKQYGVIYWTSGVLRGKTFKNISPEVTSMYDFIIVSNEDEDSFTYVNSNQSQRSEWLLTTMGQLKDLKGQDIARADYCYGYNTNGGCQRLKQPVCRHHGDIFDLRTGFLVAGDFSANYDSSLGISDCRAICWNNCGCVAFTSWFPNDTGCRFWTGKWQFLPGPGEPPSIFVLSSNDSSPFLNGTEGSVKSFKSVIHRRGTKKWIPIAISLLVIFLCILCYLLRRKVALEDHNTSKLLDWKQRFKIIEGIAQGMIYLHKYSRLRVIHRDLKASNILLDESMNPKISDFGLARIFEQNELAANTSRIVGTYGYMSPEYAMKGVFSIKSDVYSFGVLMLEIVSGRRNNSFQHVDDALNLVGYAWDLWQKGEGIELVDPAISDSCVKYQVLRCIHVSLLCVEDGAIDRPTMSDVLFLLTNESMPLPLPKKPAFSIGRKAIEANISYKESNNHSLNGLSISEMDAR